MNIMVEEIFDMWCDTLQHMNSSFKCIATRIKIIGTELDMDMGRDHPCLGSGPDFVLIVSGSGRVGSGLKGSL